MPGSLAIQRNLITNADFSDYVDFGSYVEIARWFEWDCFFDLVDGAIKMEQNSGGNDFGGWVTIFEGEGLFPETEYTFSCEVLFPAGQVGYIWAGYYDAPENVSDPAHWVGQEAAAEFIGTGDWQTLEGSFTTAAGTRSMEFGPFWGDIGNSFPSIAGDTIYLRNPYIRRPQPQLELFRSLTPNPDLDFDVSDWDVRRGTPVWEAGGVLKITSTVTAGFTTTALPEAADPVLLPGWGEILFPLHPGETYNFSFRSKSDLGKDMFVYNAFAAADGNESSENYQLDFVGTGDWQTVEGSWTVPETLASLGGQVPVGGYFAIGMDSGDNAVGKVWRLDDLQLDKVNVTLDLPTRQNEKKRVTISGTDLGGTFAIVFQGNSTEPIAYNANAAAVQTAMESLPNVNVGDVFVTEAGLSGQESLDVFIEFEGQYAGQDVLGSLSIDIGDPTNYLQNQSFESASPVTWTAYGANITSRRQEGTDLAPPAQAGDWMLECEYDDDIRIGSLALDLTGLENSLVRISMWVYLETWDGGVIELTDDGTLAGATLVRTQAPDMDVLTSWQQIWIDLQLANDAVGEIYIIPASPPLGGGLNRIFVDDVYFGAAVGLEFSDLTTTASNVQNGVGSKTRLQLNPL